MLRRLWLAALAIPLMAAAPPRSLSLSVPGDTSLVPQPQIAGHPQRYEPAPLPNRGVSLPQTHASNEPSVAPTLFTTREQYRGDGFSRGSTPQGEQERNMKPPVGFSLHMPFAPQ